MNATQRISFCAACLPRTLRRGLAAAFLLLAVPGVWAGEKNRLPATPMPSYQQECGSCHLAYPPGMLPAQSWSRILGGLQSHYGTDASSDTTDQFREWLLGNAGTGKRVNGAPPQDRITLSDWFVREHRKLKPGVWSRPSVSSAANCAACHSQAEQGDYRERNIRIPN